MNTVYKDLKTSGSPWKAGSKYILCRTAHPFPLGDDTLALPPEGMHEIWQ
ncbi:hypothetical protein Spica_1011 [Gracilinema caldarium DSM 7334]|uniref:Uncharacterized protein n=1 Tax=Gracilinema caldarium (strain ATCC 51460 / DSM 7334 / H1) TaxID=744872 RepID=F8EXD3_GRAC1|nr:hypothetical protein Spica_1011 [Gracilinema caldarium DSM 7334]